MSWDCKKRKLSCFKKPTDFVSIHPVKTWLLCFVSGSRFQLGVLSPSAYGHTEVKIIFKCFYLRDRKAEPRRFGKIVSWTEKLSLRQISSNKKALLSVKIFISFPFLFRVFQLTQLDWQFLDSQQNFPAYLAYLVCYRKLAVRYITDLNRYCQQKYAKILLKLFNCFHEIELEFRLSALLTTYDELA